MYTPREHGTEHAHARHNYHGIDVLALALAARTPFSFMERGGFTRSRAHVKHTPARWRAHASARLFPPAPNNNRLQREVPRTVRRTHAAGAAVERPSECYLSVPCGADAEAAAAVRARLQIG